MDWQTICICIVFPILCVGVLFFLKRRLFWLAPIVSTILTVLLGMATSPTILTDNEHRAMFFGLLVPMHLGVVIPLTVVAAVVAWAWKRKPAAPDNHKA